MVCHGDGSPSCLYKLAKDTKSFNYTNTCNKSYLPLKSRSLSERYFTTKLSAQGKVDHCCDLFTIDNVQVDWGPPRSSEILSSRMELAVAVTFSLSPCQDDECYEQSADVRSQLRFFEQLERIEKQRKDEQEREILLKAAKVSYSHLITLVCVCVYMWQRVVVTLHNSVLLCACMCVRTSARCYCAAPDRWISVTPADEVTSLCPPRLLAPQGSSVLALPLQTYAVQPPMRHAVEALTASCTWCKISHYHMSAQAEQRISFEVEYRVCIH